MSISLPGANITGVTVGTSGEITLSTASGVAIPAGTMPGYTKGWIDECGRVNLEKDNGEQTTVCNLSNNPLALTVATPSGAVLGPKMFTGAATTDSTGSVTFTWPTGFFTSILSAQATVERNTTDVTRASFCWVSEWNMTRAIVRVAESKTSGVLLGGSIEGIELAGAGILVHAMVIGV
jgi:hypothetical protein